MIISSLTDREKLEINLNLNQHSLLILNRKEQYADSITLIL